MVDESKNVLMSTDTAHFRKQSSIRSKDGSDAPLLLRGKPINNSQSTYQMMLSDQNARQDSKYSKEEGGLGEPLLASS